MDYYYCCSIDLTLNWLLNVYDLGRQGQLRNLSFQVGLVIMCRGAAEDKFNCKYDILIPLLQQRVHLIGYLVTSCVSLTIVLQDKLAAIHVHVFTCTLFDLDSFELINHVGAM